MFKLQVFHPTLLTTAVLLCLSVAAPFTVQAQEGADLASRAAAAIQAADWTKAAELYEQMTVEDPKNGAAWYRLGLSISNSNGEAGAARTAFERAVEHGFAPGPAYFGIAKTHMGEGDRAAALETLERLADQGPARFVATQVSGDELFAPLSSDPRFESVIKRLVPCMTDEYRQFDFWIGEWKVFSPTGQEVGANTVTQSMDGCLLMENWTSAFGGQRGMSINYYDRDQGTWSQVYRDNSGNISQWPELVGGLVDGAMVLDSGPETNPRSRWTWTKQDDGRVRQMAETTTDGGETWNVVWDSYYQLVDSDSKE